MAVLILTQSVTIQRSVLFWVLLVCRNAAASLRFRSKAELLDEAGYNAVPCFTWAIPAA
jgi:hypothetical protein